MKKIDLHMHSTCSDGTNTPTELIKKVALAGIEMAALTDHDTIKGLDEAKKAAKMVGVELIRGVEISCTHTLSGGYGKHQEIDKIIHVVALNFSDSLKMNEALQSLQDSRHLRGRQIIQKLADSLMDHPDEAAALFENLWQQVLTKVSGNARAVGRAHIGQVLHELGYVPSVQAAFDKYLADNKPAYVPIQTINMADTVALIHECGGLAVLAHPTRYKLSATRTQRLISDFAQCGGDGCELPNHEPLSCVEMVSRAIAKHELAVSLGSDFHGSNMPWRKLGSTAAMQKDQVGIWERFDQIY
ncbi:PHP domain-containing protein [Moraxella canis]|uniref:PHP domain-containing protein n=1 Tax=Moraxella canis TaxID=90239 RepID=A0ABZ0WVX4_9GAMM|nr:PHP domain-containing protein [Moraxella canis]WQE03408.1 PHP domain-containing protein [Moraxella canis]